MMALRDLLSYQNIWFIIDGLLCFAFYKLANVKVQEWCSGARWVVVLVVHAARKPCG